ncbi:hypothetical protein MCERH10_02808 [Caulobacteraceae bacterium]
MGFFRIQKDPFGLFWWHFWQSEKTLIATSARGYANEEECRKAIVLVKHSHDAPCTVLRY